MAAITTRQTTSAVQGVTNNNAPLSNTQLDNNFINLNSELIGKIGIAPRVVTITDGATVTLNSDTTDVAVQTNTQAAGTLTMAAPTGTPSNGQKMIFRLQSTNVQTFSWNAAFAGSTDQALPTSSSGGSKYDYMGFIYNTTASKWQLLAINFGF